METTDRPLQRLTSLLRRLAAIFYDSLLLLAMAFLLTIPILQLTGGQAIAPSNLFYRVYLLLWAFLFLGGFWTRRGQTPGMYAWRLQIQQTNGQAITWFRALLRFGLALLSWLPLGAGFWWALFDPQGKTWHDRLSATELVSASSRSIDPAQHRPPQAKTQQRGKGGA